jgi:transcriptional regulator with XRE-family HTH domain
LQLKKIKFVTIMTTHHSFVGSKIKGIRESKNISIEEVSERSGLTTEQINSIETDQNLPSLGPLIKIARALGVRLGTFLDDSDALGPIVCRAADREKDSSISFSNGASDARKHMEYHPLAQQKAGRHMEPFIIDINPEEAPNFQLSAHEGEEFIYVMQGEVEIVYGKETYNLKEGDSIFYDSIVNHHVHGAPGKAAKILAVVYIPF